MICNKIKELTEIYSVKVIDIDTEVIVFEICNSKDMIDAFIDVVRPFEIVESVRTGVIALQRGNQHI